MGVFRKLSHKLKFKKEKITILIVGLNYSGKTSIINHLKNSSDQSTGAIPTVGFNIAQFENNGIYFSVIDMSGSRRYRNLWDHHFKICHGIVYVIDSTDKMRLIVVKDEINLLVQHPDLKKHPIPILLYGNKSDCADAMSSGKIASALELQNIKDTPWYICSSSATSGEGLEDGVLWLIQNIRLTMKKQSQ